MYIVVTFNYDTVPTQGGQPPQAPPVREANWSISTSLIEVPAYSWKAISGMEPEGIDLILNIPSPVGKVSPITNPVGDIYEGVTRVEPLVTISVTQFEEIDPTRHALYAGVVNTNPVRVGTLICPPRSVMFRGVQTSPAIETFGGAQYSGWTANYEFAYRRNYVWFGMDQSGKPIEAEIGWDWLQPVSGFNVKAFNPAAPLVFGDADPWGQPLKRNETTSEVIGPPFELPDGVNAGDKMRACVRIANIEGKGTVQRPSAQPIALNNDGTPRKDTADPKVRLHRYQVQPDIDFELFGLRLL
jgi:hypothetical protein